MAPEAAGGWGACGGAGGGRVGQLRVASTWASHITALISMVAGAEPPHVGVYFNPVL
jgi:hypothetical protein